MPGVTIGEGAIVGAGSLVTKRYSSHGQLLQVDLLRS